MKVITVTNRKGGVGKSTMSAHLAAGLAIKGYNVGCIDADSQGHLALMFGMEQSNGLFNVMISKSPLEREMGIVPAEYYSTPDHPSKGNLYLLPGYDKTFEIPHALKGADAFVFLDLAEKIGQLADLDYLIIDTQPTMSKLDGAIFLATDAFLHVTELEVLAISGLQDAIIQTQEFSATRKQYLKRDTIVAGIIPNKFRTNTNTHIHNLNAIAQEYGAFNDGGLVLSPCRLLTVWTQACNERVPMYVFESSGEAAHDAWRIVNSVEERLQQWVAQAE